MGGLTGLTKYETAQRFFPGLRDRSARRKLMRWIHQATGLMPALLATGYNPYQHYFTYRQLELLYEYLGEP